MKSILGVAFLLLIVNTLQITDAAEEIETTTKYSESDLESLSAKQKQIVQSYESISTLNYGDKCNYALESKGAGLRENLKDYLKKAVVSGIQQGLAGKTKDELELSPSVEDARDEVFSEMEEYVAKVQNSKDGLNGICNDTKTLYCDQEVGECRCGKPKKN